ncbi:hypothetical protein [Jeotgalibacillus salarius]|uniref:Uncharacterized protein n=1 Tax=Jeotgalibacillus salarius TaxID=546023 RepID=A0A4Y8LA45_9BACL|nr:hypothetical protein [Jeotgalibacillus salarius]TFD99453.1 hypothetical protein E2626_14435 [Jeotgalibacillus salarius]
MGWSIANQTDFSGYQIEFAVIYTIFFIASIWVFYDSDHYFMGFKRHFFWILTLTAGAVGMILYIIFRRLEKNNSTLQ